jgi:hypothetical protein
MTLVMVERSFDSPVAFEDIQALEDAGAWCLEAHQVTFIKTFFSADRKRMLCLYEAPDAESVRLAQKKAEVPFDCAWSCTALVPESRSFPGNALHPPVPILVEREFDAPTSADDVRQMVRSGAWCFDQHRTGYRESYLAQDGLRMVCLFEAPDMESVRHANRTLQFPVHRLWATTVHVPPAAGGSAVD